MDSSPTIQLPTPAIIAHRGASAYAPENTLSAFELAVQQGADAIEFDVKLSADDHPVIIHDRSVGRTTDGHGLVADLPLAALRQLDAGSYFDPAFSGEKIPTLGELFERLGHRIYLNIELTNYTTPGDALPEIVAALVKQHNLGEQVMFSSFNPTTLRRIRALLPDIPVGLLALRGLPGFPTRTWMRFFLKYEALHPDHNDVSQALVRNYHRHGTRVHAYTVNLPAELKRMFSLGIDAVFSDDPSLARQMLVEHNSSLSADIPPG